MLPELRLKRCESFIEVDVEKIKKEFMAFLVGAKNAY